MNSWKRARFAREIANEMRRRRPETRWTSPESNIWLVDVDGYVDVTISTREGDITFKLKLNDKVAQRQEPADNRLLESARALFYEAFDAVARREVGLRETT